MGEWGGNNRYLQLACGTSERSGKEFYTQEMSLQAGTGVLSLHFSSQNYACVFFFYFYCYLNFQSDPGINSGQTIWGPPCVVLWVSPVGFFFSGGNIKDKATNAD